MNIKIFITALGLLFNVTKAISDQTKNISEYFDMSSTMVDSDPNAKNGIWRAIGITIFCGCAAFIGASSIFCIKKEHTSVMPISLSFAAGVTIYLSLVNLIPEAIESFQDCTNDESQAMPQLYTLLCVILGLIITASMEILVHSLGADTHSHSDASSDSDPEKADSDPENALELKIHSPTKSVIKDKNYARVSYSVAFALILHHFPEGIATFVSLYYDLEFGLLVALALALHDIPSGVCISVPIYLSSGSVFKPFLLCFIAAMAYPIGAFVGLIFIQYLTDEFVAFFIAVLFGITGGIMLYISFVELLPTAIIGANKCAVKNQKRWNASLVSVIVLFLGMFVMAISNILLSIAGGHNH